jgi:hypothetical protein
MIAVWLNSTGVTAINQSTRNQAIRYHTDEECRQEFMRLVRYHPKTQIQHDLKAMVDSGEVIVSFDETLLTQGSEAIAEQLPEKPGQPIAARKIRLVFKRDFLYEPRAEDSYQQIIIWQEYQYVLQIKRGEREVLYQIFQKAERYGQDSISASDWRAIGKLQYWTQVPAYSATCDLAQELRKTAMFELCEIREKEGEPAFRRYIAEEFLIPHMKSPPQIEEGIRLALAGDSRAH